MSNDIIQARYDGLAGVANRFGNQAHSNEDLLARVLQSLRPLEGGGWQGRGSTAFFAEMNGELLPAMHRLAAALDRAREVTLDIARVLREAEEEASQPFRGGAAGVTPGGSADYTLGGAAGAGSGAGSASAAGDTSRIFAPDYMDGLVGLQVRGADSAPLNRAMETLAGNPTPQQVQQALDQIAEARGRPFSTTVVRPAHGWLSRSLCNAAAEPRGRS